MLYSFKTVFENLRANKAWRDYPGQADPRRMDGWLWPHVQPSFTIDPAAKPAIFTIGSCFARNIENALAPLGFELPTWGFVTPAHELGIRGPQGMLNEFNPGSVQQRILYALEGREFDDQSIVPGPGGTFADLLLVRGADVIWERALERRREVDDVYRQLVRCPFVLMTLGLSEAWYDHQAQIYLNRMPPFAFMESCPDRYSLRKLSAEDCHALLEPAIAALVERGIKVILTVSPVPLKTTLTRVDAITANEASKAALRLCAERLCQQFPHVDYFPSYEIVRSGGLQSYGEDQIHVKPELIHRITQFMVNAYCSRVEPSEPVANDGSEAFNYFDGH
jgi:hypothetical protein